MPIRWALGAIVGGAVFLLIVLTLTHMGTTDRTGDTAVVPSTVAPVQSTASPQQYFPFQC
ncbi:hypothetical protein [Nocardia sp. NPDC052112]|uniref:hypothetical protein n=1 Tax=Nocardia sp. NPDC052112 TaxID=3155646 RepID=UPI003427AF05